MLTIEKLEQFDHKIGKSTSEVSVCFLKAVLNLAYHLGHKQIFKSGGYLWFYRNLDNNVVCCTKVSPKSQPRLTTFQLARSKLDQKMLEKAAIASVYGNKNLNQRILLPDFHLKFDSAKLISSSVRRWVSLEWQNLFLRVPNTPVPVSEQIPSISRH